jgi:GrpB-like predicted nucleotidyltransferase (UPF0157 family)
MQDSGETKGSGSLRSGSDEYLARVTIGERRPHDGTIYLADYDPSWPARYAELARRIRAALARKVLLLEHVGSTAVPGLCAKPIIDAVLAVSDAADEPSYVSSLEERGFVLRTREPEWFEHRLLKGTDIECNLHVFSFGCAEIDRMLAFRDRLCADEADRTRYEQAKRELAQRTWRDVQHYADAKSDVVREILQRAPGAAARRGG